MQIYVTPTRKYLVLLCNVGLALNMQQRWVNWKNKSTFSPVDKIYSPSTSQSDVSQIEIYRTFRLLPIFL